LELNMLCDCIQYMLLASQHIKYILLETGKQ
jgi:hypothetical protein